MMRQIWRFKISGGHLLLQLKDNPPDLGSRLKFFPATHIRELDGQMKQWGININ